LNHYLSAAGIRAYHACDIREAEILLSITRAKVLLIDIDRTYEPWREILRKLDESRPNLPKVVLTARDHNIWPLLFFQFALDVVPKPAQLGDLLGALECAHQLDQELSDPARARERERRVLAAIRSTAPCGSASVPCSAFHSLQAHWSALMDRVPHFWLKFGCYLTRKQHFHA
jgi:DNA-binding NtrC family response regulator